MLNRKLHPKVWQPFFDDLSKRLRRGDVGPFARLRVVVPGTPGTQDVVHGQRLEGVSYDRRDGALYLLFERLTHRAARPEVIWARVGPGGAVEELLVLCQGGYKVAVELSAYRTPPDPYASTPARAGTFHAAVKAWWDRVKRRAGASLPIVRQDPYEWPSEEMLPDDRGAERPDGGELADKISGLGQPVPSCGAVKARPTPKAQSRTAACAAT